MFKIHLYVDFLIYLHCLFVPLAHLFSSSLATSIVPRQWKAASVCPVQKVTAPKEHVDFRPISITPVLSRILESDYIYRALLSPPPPLTISDQFASVHLAPPLQHSSRSCTLSLTFWRQILMLLS